MNIAALHKRILFQKNETVTDVYGNHTNSWMDYGKAWATVSTDSYGSESSGVVVNPEETLNFTTRWSRELDAVVSTKYRILCEGRIYNIIYVNPMGYKHKSLKFACKLEKGKKT